MVLASAHTGVTLLFCLRVLVDMKAPCPSWDVKKTGGGTYGKRPYLGFLGRPLERLDSIGKPWLARFFFSSFKS